MNESKFRLSSFSVIIVMVALMIIGASMIFLLSVQLNPSRSTQSLSVGCSWSGASPEIMEREVISKLEGALARLEGIKGITSVSNQGSGNLTLTFKEGTKMDVARFEAASQLRYIYPKLPRGVSYPSLSGSTTGDRGSNPQIVSYTINTSLSGEETEKFITESILPPLSRISKVSDVRYSGIPASEYVITVDPDLAASAGITMSHISRAFNNYFAESTLGNVTYGEDDENVILLKTRMNTAIDDFGHIPIAKIQDKVITLRELATVKYQQQRPQSYSRINGLNTLSLSVAGEKGVNTVKLSAEVKSAMKELSLNFPDGFTAEINFDAAEYINKELRTIMWRTIMTLVILLLFVFAVSRNFAYLFVIFITLVANILVAIIFYNLLDIEMHLYSLAGITVSLGIIIDTSIIMVDHYSYYHDRKAFISILGAILTNIASLTVVFLLPNHLQINFGGFAWVIIINLLISLVISLLFIPSLLDCFPIKKPMTAVSRRVRRFISGYNRRYKKFIYWNKRHKWIFIVLLVLGFGFPIHKLPNKINADKDGQYSRWAKNYNKTIGGTFYQDNKGIFEKVLGGSFRLFDTKKPPARSVQRDPEKITLTIRAGMVEGNTVHQLNDIVRHMENFLSKYDQIESFRTSVSSYDNSSISVTFKPEYEKTYFPYELFSNVTREALKFGGATWKAYGLPNKDFNNDIASSSSYKPHRIAISGYNYENLLKFAENLRDTLSLNRRVSDPQIYGEVNWQVRKQEYFVDLDREKLLKTGSTPEMYFGELGQLLFSSSLGSYSINQKRESVTIESRKKDSFDLWHVINYPIKVDSVRMKLSDFGTIDKRYSGLSIYKNNQAYQLIVAFDFIGSWELSEKLINGHIKRLNDEILPIGYKAFQEEGWNYGSAKDTKRYYLLILLVIVIIYSICTILFESFHKPLVIIIMIPVSFIGVFLTFGIFGFKFDQGGFASFILLSGLVVNAGIYIVNEFNIISRRTPHRNLMDIYIKSYSRKIIPIMLTIISTILGLIPFIVNGKGDVFWYSFAVGTMGGMVFSVIAFIIYLPLFLPLKSSRLHEPTEY